LTILFAIFVFAYTALNP